MTPPETAVPSSWAKIIDHTRCIGCHACTTACKSENEVPLAVTRTYVKYVDVGVFPETRRAFQVTRCNQCDDAPCTHACPTRAMFRRADGIVDFDKSLCIGCKACMAACPYDAIFINPDDHSAEKCNFCAHRIDRGLEPACVVVCPTEAILVGRLDDPQSKVGAMLGREVLAVRRPEKETRPKLFYRGAHQATLEPLAARRPEGGLFLWSQQSRGPDQLTSGHPRQANSSAAAVLSYDVVHRMPWDWRVSFYTWTKGIAAGVYLIGLLLAGLGLTAWTGALWLRTVPLISLVYLALTGAILIADLEHPARFYFIFRHPHWRSWLVRGGFLLAAWGLVLSVHAVAGLVGASTLTQWLAPAGAVLALLVAVYTAWLFAQAKARDLWQNPLAPVQLTVQAVLLGSASLLWVALFREPGAVPMLLRLLAGACALILLLVLAEHSLTHATAHARLAAWEMTRGRYAVWFWAAIVMIGVGCAAPWVGVWATVPAALGILAYEHAYVQAGQSVPLA